MMVVYKGKVFFEDGDTAKVSNVASVRKSVLDMLFAVEGKAITDDNVLCESVVKPGLQDKVPFVHPEELANFDQLLNHGIWGTKQVADGGVLSWSTTLVTPFGEMNPAGFHNAGMPGRWGYGRLWWVWDAPLFPGNTYVGRHQGAYSAMGTGGQVITVFPMWDLVVVHTVDIDADGGANVSQLGYQAILDRLLAARCAGECK